MRPDLPQFCDALDFLCASAGTLTEAIDITPFPLTAQNVTRRTFRLTFADGSILKGRQFPNSAMAASNHLLRNALDTSFLSRIIARHDNALLEEWIPGTPPENLDLPAFHFCGRHLRNIHNTPVPVSFPFPAWDPAAWINRTRQSLAALRDAAKISITTSQTLERILDAQPFPEGPMVINLHDLCPENLILESASSLRCIDAGSLMLGLPEQDLARIWLRWPMTDTQRSAFAEGYGTPCESLRTPSLFWRIVLFANTARFRLQSGGPDVHHGVARLLDIARQEATSCL